MAFNKLKDLVITYNGSNITKGDFLTINKTITKPNFYYKFDDNTYYTLIMIDSDAPSKNNPIYRNWIHWIITKNSNGNTFGNTFGNTLINYMKPLPPQNSREHRYIFILFKQNKKIK
jgi:phosphatidylethanolamine-binding protein (PEBP) family uncharacterized protein